FGFKRPDGPGWQDSPWPVRVWQLPLRRGLLQGASLAARLADFGGRTVRGKVRVLSMLGLSLALFGCGSGNDYGGQTGYDYLPRCQLVVRGPRTEREIVSATYCVGAV